MDVLETSLGVTVRDSASALTQFYRCTALVTLQHNTSIITCNHILVERPTPTPHFILWIPFPDSQSLGLVRSLLFLRAALCDVDD